MSGQSAPRRNPYDRRLAEGKTKKQALRVAGSSDRSLPNPTPNLRAHVEPESVRSHAPPNKPLAAKRLRYGRASRCDDTDAFVLTP